MIIKLLLVAGDFIFFFRLGGNKKVLFGVGTSAAGGMALPLGLIVLVFALKSITHGDFCLNKCPHDLLTVMTECRLQLSVPRGHLSQVLLLLFTEISEAEQTMYVTEGHRARKGRISWNFTALHPLRARVPS